MSAIIQAAPAAQPSKAEAPRAIDRWIATAAHVVEWVIPFSLVTIIIVGTGWVVFAAQ